MSRQLFLLSVILIAAVAVQPVHALDLNPLSAIKGAVEAAVEDRSTSDIAKDTTIKAKITANVIDKMGTDVISISADVYEQNVMLAGIVETEAQKNQAGDLTKSIENVKTVYNEILVIKKIDRQKGTAESFVDDSVIESKINALLLDAKGVNVTNFRWRSMDGHVFLFGRALSRDELDKAIAIVKDIKDVVSVKSQVVVRAK